MEGKEFIMPFTQPLNTGVQILAEAATLNQDETDFEPVPRVAVINLDARLLGEIKKRKARFDAAKRQHPSLREIHYDVELSESNVSFMEGEYEDLSQPKVFIKERFHSTTLVPVRIHKMSIAVHDSVILWEARSKRGNNFIVCEVPFSLLFGPEITKAIKLGLE